MTLRDLPVQPTYTEDRVQSAYIEELKKVTTAEQLKAFVERWKPLYKLTKYHAIDKHQKDARRFRVSQKNEQRLTTGDLDFEEALKCIADSRENICKHAAMYSCPGASIVAPRILLQATLVSQRYGVSTDLALIQMNGGVAALEGG